MQCSGGWPGGEVCPVFGLNSPYFSSALGCCVNMFVAFVELLGRFQIVEANIIDQI